MPTFRTREKKVVDSGKGVKRTGLNISKEELRKAQERAETIRKANATAESRAAQQKKNDKVKTRMKFEIDSSRWNNQKPDEGALYDYANSYGYVPVGDELQKANTRTRLRKAFRKKNK